MGTLISLEAQVTAGTSLLYFPLPFGLTLIYWWGPRILPAFYINAVSCAGLWGLDKAEFWPLYGLPETVFVFLSWLLFVKFSSGKIGLPNTKQVIYFLISGILIPLIVYKFILESIFVLTGDAPADKYWNLLITTGFGDFISVFCVSIPLLYFLTHFWMRKGLLTQSIKTDLNALPNFSRVQWLELFGAAILSYLINFFLGFVDYWFLNGILSLYVAIRFGFGSTILLNSYILIITYVIPATSFGSAWPTHFLESNMLKTQLGTALLYVFSIITGRLVSDMRFSEHQLNNQNKELSVMNTELDRFVYSVSHDLSAPLKSILGLVNISRMTNRESDLRIHFDLIEKSVNKLENFVSEVLDYSKNKRMEVIREPFDLKDLAQEIFDDFKFIEGTDEIKFDTDEIGPRVISTDRARLKITLQNIISNAIKYRRKNVQSYIKLNTKLNNDYLVLNIEDNGEGIRPELQPKVFDMFFKGTENSKGAGLGLYIAQEAAKKIDAQISVQSTFGKGTIFSIKLLIPKP